MRDIETGQVARRLRRRLGWRQEDCAERARVHRSTWGALEAGQLDGMTLGTLRRCLAAVGVSLDLIPRWRGAGLDRLMDEVHADLEAAWADLLRRWGWLVWAEVSFNRYGDRGRVDLLAWHPIHHVLCIVEIKGEFVDAQGTLGALDVKIRVGRELAKLRDLPVPRLVVPVLIIRDTVTVRRRLDRVAPLFEGFAHRGREAIGCLRHPERIEGGMLILSDLSSAARSSAKKLGPQRIRRRRDQSSSDEGGGEASSAHGPL